MVSSFRSRCLKQCKSSLRNSRSGVLILCVAALVGGINTILARGLIFMRDALSLNSDENWLLPVYGCVVAQLIVPLLWSVFANRLLIWRLLVFFLAIPLICNPTIFFDPRLLALLELILPIALAAFIPLAIYRFCGQWEMIYRNETPMGNSRQLSITDMGTLTLVVAVAITGQQHYRDSVDWDRFLAGLELAIMWGIAAYTMIVVVVWLPWLYLLMENPSKKRIRLSIGFEIVVFAIAIILSLFQDERILLLFVVTGFFFALDGLTIAILWLLKRIGFRLVKSP